MLAAMKTPVRRGTQHLIFSAHDAEWDAILTRGPQGELVYLFIHPALNEFGDYPARLLGDYASASSLCQMVNALLERHSPAAIADVITATQHVANGHALAVVRREYEEMLPQIIRLLKRDAP
ncbi:MAG: hypothetical protein COB49_01860 [Alphaproteobacteria bacterium]|nr:MAG: hypothetical protein COB49_01860 [Alphaproteobacteria bacterium]